MAGDDRATIAASTHKRYGQLLRLHAYPHIGRLRLTKLEPPHLGRLYPRLVKAGLSPTTVLQLHRVLHHALKDAHRQGLAPRDVADLVTPPLKDEYDFLHVLARASAAVPGGRQGWSA